MTDAEVNRARDLLSTVELSLTELSEVEGFWRHVSCENKREYRHFKWLVGATKLSLPPMRN